MISGYLKSRAEKDKTDLNRLKFREGKCVLFSNKQKEHGAKSENSENGVTVRGLIQSICLGDGGSVSHFFLRLMEPFFQYFFIN